MIGVWGSEAHAGFAALGPKWYIHTCFHFTSQWSRMLCSRTKTPAVDLQPCTLHPCSSPSSTTSLPDVLHSRDSTRSPALDTPLNPNYERPSIPPVGARFDGLQKVNCWPDFSGLVWAGECPSSLRLWLKGSGLWSTIL